MIRTFEVIIEYPDSKYLSPGYNKHIQEMIEEDFQYCKYKDKVKITVKETTL